MFTTGFKLYFGMGMLFLVRTLAAEGSSGGSRAARRGVTWRSTVSVGTSWGTPAVAVAALAFMLSPYVLQYEARISALLMPWAALPRVSDRMGVRRLADLVVVRAG